MTAPRGSADERGPIESATAHLIDWLTDTAGVRVRATAPAPAEARTGTGTGGDTDDGSDDATEDGAGDGLSVWPLALLPERELRSAAQREPLRFRVRHLVTGATAALDRVLVAAVAPGAPTINLEPPSDQAWLALRVRPQPALLIDVPATVARPTPVVPRVRSPLQVRGGPPQAVSGRVLGPDDQPLAGIRVEVVSTGAWTYSDTAGRFAFAAVPDEQPVRLALRGKGVQLAAQAQPGEDVVINFNINFEEA